MNDQYTPGVPTMLRLLISSTTNVAVDRILLGYVEKDQIQIHLDTSIL